MPDHAVSSAPAVQAQLDRLWAQSPGVDVLGLDRIAALLARLGNPERRLPPVFHVAGTNGKGSTCAFLRAMLEAAGLRVHVYTSPHLVRLNERIRIAGELVQDEVLAQLLSDVIDVAAAIKPTFFEATTAAAMLGFSRTSADALVVEVGLGGGRDATNVFSAPAACAIAQIALDHRDMLGLRIEAIAREKAGIAKRGVPLITQQYSPRIASTVAIAAAALGAEWLPRGTAWTANLRGGRLYYRDYKGSLSLQPPILPGRHQAMNAALAIAMLRHQRPIELSDDVFERAMREVVWPARLQRLVAGPLNDLLRPGSALWVDGGHNPEAANEIARFFRRQRADGPFHLICGMLDTKAIGPTLKPFLALDARVHAVPIPGHTSYRPARIVTDAVAVGLRASVACSAQDALHEIAAEDGPREPTVLIFGSLHLAAQVLLANGEQLV